MRIWIIYILLVCGITKVAAQDMYAVNAAKYVNQYKMLAMAEQQRSGVPAAITLGQGILETEAGCSILATGANNHFGIKCKQGWTGETFSHTDDAPDECFRKYNCAADSYRDHSDYLKNSARYAALFRLQNTDYVHWAYGLKRCGYATNPKYAQKLIKIIEDFNLEDYTEQAMSTANSTAAAKTQTIPVPAMSGHETPPPPEEHDKIIPNAPPQDLEGRILTVNGLKAIYAFKGEQLLSVALKYHIRYARLLEMNDLPDAPLACNMYIYLERKNLKGTHVTHLVKPGEMLIQIAQLEGIQLRRLMTLNRISWGEEPAAGAVLQLQHFAVRKPEMIADISDPRPIDAPKADVIIRKGSHIKEVTGKETTPTPQMINATPVATAPVQTVPPVSAAPPLPVNTEAPKTTQQTGYIDTKAKNTVTTLSVAPVNTPPIPAAPVIVKQESALVKPIADMPAQKTDDVNTMGGDKKEESTIVKETPVASAPAQQAPEAVKPLTTTEIPTKENAAETIIENHTPAQQMPGETKPLETAQTKTEAKKDIPDIDTEKKNTASTNDEITAETPPVKTPPVNTTAKPEASEDGQPKDQLTLLKEQLDKVVYQNGQRAVAPAAAPEQKAEKKDMPVPAADDNSKYYTVKDGDTAYGIAKDHNITVRQLMDWNDLNFDAIKTGERLRVKE